VGVSQMETHLEAFLREAHWIGRRFVDAGNPEPLGGSAGRVLRELDGLSDLQVLAFEKLPGNKDLRRGRRLR